ncbi:MAG: DUF1573 domain-containing protein [Deltaproteobacteria bacterium]|nr:DUF1573 domain-containing protein [Deltaproteobacteria bacterium]
MGRTIKVVALHLICGLFILTTTAQAGNGKPRITVPTGAIDLGASYQGEKASGKITIGNAGDKTLNIIKLTPSCGCTVAELTIKTIEHGKEIAVPVSIDTTGKIGLIRKTIEIQSDDPERPKLTVELQTVVSIREHSTMTMSKTLFQGDCAGCHALPGKDKTGETLFEAVCAVCHGHYGLGGTIRMNDLNWLEAHDDAYLKKIIADGKAGTSMPGFSIESGGPLNKEQIDSLVELMRWWREGFIFKQNAQRHGYGKR